MIRYGVCGGEGSGWRGGRMVRYVFVCVVCDFSVCSLRTVTACTVYTLSHKLLEANCDNRRLHKHSPAHIPTTSQVAQHCFSKQRIFPMALDLHLIPDTALSFSLTGTIFHQTWRQLLAISSRQEQIRLLGLACSCVLFACRPPTAPLQDDSLHAAGWHFTNLEHKPMTVSGHRNRF